MIRTIADALFAKPLKEVTTMARSLAASDACGGRVTASHARASHTMATSGALGARKPVFPAGERPPCCVKTFNEIDRVVQLGT